LKLTSFIIKQLSFTCHSRNIDKFRIDLEDRDSLGFKHDIFTDRGFMPFTLKAWCGRKMREKAADSGADADSARRDRRMPMIS